MVSAKLPFRRFGGCRLRIGQPSSPWRNSRTPLTDVRGSVDSARYRAATVRERFHHGLLGLLQKSRAQGVRHLENSSDHPFGQGVEVSAFIGVHQRPIIMKCRSPPRTFKDDYWPPMNTDERRRFRTNPNSIVQLFRGYD